MTIDRVQDLMLGVLGGAVRVGTPFLFVSLGECLIEKSGRIKLGLEGVLVFLALAGFASACLRGSPWPGVLLAGIGGAAKALGYAVNGVRIAATPAGGFIAGLGGASLSLYYPGSWNEGLSSGQGLIAVALVIFARWSPWRCLGAEVGGVCAGHRHRRPGSGRARRARLPVLCAAARRAGPLWQAAAGGRASAARAGRGPGI